MSVTSIHGKHADQAQELAARVLELVVNSHRPAPVTLSALAMALACELKRRSLPVRAGVDALRSFFRSDLVAVLRER